ncbi:sigma-70 family RNA polymerase sigma factor [Singulisphaera sp. GP187]|uniref:sigma-70 family RNA polymerase sigma factor n=1 Tax=Singulisphaera sp. GP187 TaxID=1882752 RepID=UPI000940D8E4|nr:sigma-70 family RNA polymerase sigma factor [Singulisphaera sp. GP187]
MPAKLTSGIARDLETLFETGLSGDWTDGQLLEQFRSGPGPTAEAAFAALIRRHGPMVLRVCRGVLNDEHDAQDAFQATFLVLVRKAGSIRNRLSVASWLYGVAHRVASRAKVDLARRRTHERRAAALIKESQNDLASGVRAEQAVLDEEVHRLPEKYRALLVLCYLEGLTQDQAAASLGWPSGTVRGRLFRARELLRSRLSRRGFVLPAGVMTAGIAPREDAVAPAILFGSTSRAILLAASGNSTAPGAVSESVVALAGATLKAMSVAGIKSALVLFGLGLATASIAGLAVQFGPSPRLPIPVRLEKPAIAVAPVPTPVVVPTPRPVPLVIARPESKTPPSAPGAVSPVIANRGSVAVGYPLENIEIDGGLADWPKDRIRYPVQKLFEGTGFADLGGADLATSPDLSPSFSVGYNLRQQLIYLAVVVRDDKLVIGHTSHMDTDAVEVYIDGLRSERRVSSTVSNPFWDSVGLSDLPVQQYIAIPGPGKIYGTKYDTNPIVMAGDVKKTRTKMAFRRVGDVTTYEWAIQPFDRYPDQPTHLEVGKRIGFDLAVADKDVPATSHQGMNEPPADRLVWAYWGPWWTGIKVFNAGNLGELILAAPR